MKLTKAQKKMVEHIANKCSDSNSRDGYCDVYDITYGHKSKEKCLKKLISLGVVSKWHSEQKSRAGVYGTTFDDRGFTLYKLSSIGVKMIYDRVSKTEKENTLEARVAKVMGQYQFDEKDLEKVK